MESASELSPREVEPSLTELSESILCPILQTPMQDPVMAADGHSYERAAIEQWISQRGARAVSPLTGARLAHLELTPNITLRVIIQTYLASLPQRHIKNVSQQDLALAIKLREEELSNQLAKQHKQLTQLSLVQERLGPMAEEIERLKAEIESLRKNAKMDLGNSDNNNNNNSNNHSNNDNGQTVSSDTDPVIEKHLSDIHSLSQQLLALNKAHSANMIKRFLTNRISRKKLKQTQLIQEEENVSHRIEILEQEYQKTQAELHRRLQASLQEAELRLKSNLAEIGKKIAEHSKEEGDDDALEKLVAERRRLRESHASHKSQLEVTQGVEQKREEQKQGFAVQEQKNRLQQIRASKASKQRELSRWADYTKNYTEVIETQREKLAEGSSSRSIQIEQLCSYSKQVEIKASKLLIAWRKQEERKARELAERQAREKVELEQEKRKALELAERQAKEKAERENAEKQALLLAERQAAEREAVRIASLTPKKRVNQKAKSVVGQVSTEETAELLSYTIRGQLDEVRSCLKRKRDLVHAKGEITDLSNRYFWKITGFQYAVWSGDEELWNIFLEFLPENEAYDQLMTLINERPDITKTHGAPLSFFDALIKAYQDYAVGENRSDETKMKEYWAKVVGGAQRNMPAWFTYMFTEFGEDKAWPEKKITRRFRREVGGLKNWFESSCGISQAFYRGCGSCAQLFSPHEDTEYYDYGGYGGQSISRVFRTCPVVYKGDRKLSYGSWRLYEECDFDNTAKLKTECTKKLAALTERLSKAVKSEASIFRYFAFGSKG